MCPACMASAALLAGSVISAGGIAALAAKVFGSRKSEEQEKPNNKSERRNDHGLSSEQERTT